MGLRERGRRKLAAVILSAASLLAATACNNQTHNATVGIRENLGKSGAFLETGAAAVEAAKPHTDNVGLAYLATALDAFGRAGRAMMAAESSTKAAETAIVTLESEKNHLEKTAADREGQIERLKASFWSVRQRRLFWTVVVVLALVMALRCFGLWATGGAGRVAAFVASGLLGVLTGGASIIQAVFDNLWFRWRGKTAKGGAGA
jgi:hypothetical protein